MSAETWTDSLVDALKSVVDTLRGGFGALGRATDLDGLLGRTAPLFTQLSHVVTDLGPVPDADRFLVVGDATPGPGQATLDGFAELVMGHVRDQWTPDLQDAFGSVDDLVALVASPTISSQMADFLRTLNPMLDPEIYIRFAVHLQGAMTAHDAARAAVVVVINAAKAAVAAWEADWGDNEPMSDSEKAEIEPDVGLPEWIGKYFDDFLRANIPGADGPADARVGRDVHRAVIGGYAMDHPDRVVIGDGTIRVNVLNGGKLRLSRLFSPAGDPVSDDLQLIAFANLMRDPANNKRVHPDIADMGPRPKADTDDWGWFEIKPMADIRTAAEEVFFYYLKLWNPEVRQAHPDWEKQAGVWQPTGVFLTPHHKYLCIAITVFPGVIGYLTYKIKETAQLAMAVILAALTAQFIQRLLKSLKELADTIGKTVEAVVEFLATVALVVVAAVVIVMAAIALLPEGAIAGAAAMLVALAARAAAFLPLLQEG